jgi:hypothetical protein
MPVLPTFRRRMISPFSPEVLQKKRPILVYTKKFTHPAHFDPEDGGDMYFRNYDNTAQISTV